MSLDFNSGWGLFIKSAGSPFASFVIPAVSYPLINYGEPKETITRLNCMKNAAAFTGIGISIIVSMLMGVVKNTFKENGEELYRSLNYSICSIIAIASLSYGLYSSLVAIFISDKKK